uniref:FBD domain-containing protein n=2 Tax=Aegilops tauschii TaxID=37682 RepID=A0A453N1I6_AEGTS
VDRISSCSLKHLRITGCRSVRTPRVRVSAPDLVSLTLKLDRIDAKAPCLENMASLETAYVYLGYEGPDVCLNYHYSGGFCGANHNEECKNCAPVKDDGSGDTVLLGGVSSAKHLELISEPANFILSRDWNHCSPIFSKLKSLLLNEYWCDAPGLDPLLCILKNSPVLEELTL